MRIRKITGPGPRGKSLRGRDFEHVIGLDWSETTMAVGHISTADSIPQVWETKADIIRLQGFLKSLTGRIILTVEESTTSQWLYGKLVAYVDRLIVCDPTFNRLLCRGPKNDLVDAGKLCLLLYHDSLKEVYHSTSKWYDLRLLVSAYDDTIRSGVAAQNRLKARLRARLTEGAAAKFVIEQLQDTIARYKQAKLEFEQEFHRWAKRTPLIRALAKLPGIGERSAVKIVGTVIDARRFPTRRHYDSYCGLVWHKKQSGGNYYGRRRPQYSRLLKSVYKTAALAAIHGQNEIADYYKQLLARGLAPYNARHAVARYLAHVCYGILKSGIPYDPNFKNTQSGKHNNS